MCPATYNVPSPTVNHYDSDSDPDNDKDPEEDTDLEEDEYEPLPLLLPPPGFALFPPLIRLRVIAVVVGGGVIAGGADGMAS